MSEILSPELTAKALRLRQLLQSWDSVAVAFSGGVDSATVADAAFAALGEKAIAITSDSPSVPRQDLADAAMVARKIGIRHRIISTSEFDNPDYLKNDGSRCYHCKSELYDQILHILPELGVNVICSGANVDDMGDYRPGLMAAAERAIRHPLQEVGLMKAEIRQLAKFRQLPVWDKPASPCLSSRLAPGLAVTSERTARIEAAETWLRNHGLRECRVRLHEGELARIEVPVEAIAGIAEGELRKQLDEYFHELGFRFVTLDLTGFRTGSMNGLIPLEVRQRFVK